MIAPGREAMANAIAAAMREDEVVGEDANPASWTLISNRRSTRDTLASVDAEARAPDALPDLHEYLGFHAASGE